MFLECGEECRGNPVGMKSIGKDYYDNADKYEHSVWDEVVKAERRKVSFALYKFVSSVSAV